jgi:glycosyltransferase involved in cell wall biosynthesis
MKTYADYIQQIAKAKKISEWPTPKDFDYTVAFIQPELGTSEGVYRTFLPAMHLTVETSIRCLPVGTSIQQDSLTLNQKKYHITKDLAQACNHIVFPFTSLPLEESIKDLREHNPNLKFSYYIDYNYYYIPDSFPFVNEFGGAENIANIERNIVLVDQVIVTSKALENFLLLELSKKEHIKGCKTLIVTQPSFFDKSFTEEISPVEDKKRKKIRFGMVLNRSHFSDIAFIKGILKEFSKKHPGQIEYVVLGWNGEYQGKNYLDSLNIEYHEPVIFYDYFNTLNSLDIDCFIVPAKVNKFNDTSRNISKYIEFTRIGKPVICPDIEPYRSIITHNDNGVLCDNKESWLMELECFLSDRQKFNTIKDRAYNNVVDYEISDVDNLKKLMNIYEI